MLGRRRAARKENRMANSRSSGDIEFKVVDKVGVIAGYPTGWSKELNIISWNGGNPKFDIRDWDQEHEHMSRGVTLHEKEAVKLMELLTARLVAKEAGRAAEG